MNLRFWQSAPQRAIATPRLSARSLLLALLLVIGPLVVSVMFPRPAAAASKHPQVAPTNGTPRLEVVTNVHGQVYHLWSDDNGVDWNGWESLGIVSPAGAAGPPSALSSGPGRLDVFAQNDLGFILTDTNTNNQWSGWQQVIPGQDSVLSIASKCFGSLCYAFENNPVVTSWGPGRMDLFLNGISWADGTVALLHTWADNYTWSGQWEVLGTGSMQGTPAAVSWGSGRIDVFVRGGSNELEHKWFDGHWSSGWENLGGTFTSDPAVASPGAGVLSVFARATDGHLWSIGYAGGWGGWSDVGSGCCLAGDVESSVAAVSPGLLAVDVFVLSTTPNHALYSRADSLTGGWAGWQLIDDTVDLTSLAVTEWFPPAASSPSPTPTPSPKCGGPGQPPCILPK